MTLNAKVTIPTGHRIKHTYVCKLDPDTFQVEWLEAHNISIRTLHISIRTLRYVDEGLRWIRGHVQPDSLEADSLVAAQALVGESPWAP